MKISNANIWIRYCKWDKDTITKNEYSNKGLRICYILSGKIEWSINGERQIVQKGDVAVFSPVDKRKMIKFLSDEPLSVLMMDLLDHSTNTLHLKYIDIFSRRSVVAPRITHTEEGDDISKALSLIEEECRGGELYCNDLIELYIMTALTYIARKHYITPKKETKNYLKIKSATEYLDKHFADDIDLNELAKSLYMSQSGFSKAFKAANGIVPIAYVLKKRVEKAIDMLSSTRKTVTEIALECGFNNTASFYQAFKKIANANPKSYR